MIVSVQEALEYLKKDVQEAELRRKIDALENLIRDETNNNFQERGMRFYAPSKGGAIMGSVPFLEEGDTVEINESINSGIYTVRETGEETVRLNRNLASMGIKHAFKNGHQVRDAFPALGHLF